MAHEFQSGFSVREVPWHGLGTVLDDYPGRKDAMRIAGHDFRLLERQLLVDMPKVKAPVSIDGERWKALVRDDSGEVVSIVNGSYEVLQNDELWDIADAIIGQDNVKYETAGVLKEGALLWILARLDEPVTVKGDDSETYPYALVSTGHDGLYSAKAQAVSVRVVCWNTFKAAQAEADRSHRQFTFKHTKNVRERIEDARAALGMIRHQHEEFIHLANEIGKMKVTKEGLKTFLETFVPAPPADLLSERQATNIEKARNQIQEILTTSPTVPDKHRRTGYGLWSAGIEYLDYYRRASSDESLFRRTVFNESNIKRKLLTLVEKVSA